MSSNRLSRLSILVILLGFFLCAPIYSAPVINKPLSENQAFQVDASLKDPQTILVHWRIAPGYYLYRHAFNFRPEPASKISLAQPLFPPSLTKNIPEIGNFNIYNSNVTIAVPIINDNQLHQFMLRVYYQGCSQYGYCYPPLMKIIPIQLNAATTTHFTPLAIDPMPQSSQNISLPATRLDNLLNHGNWLLTSLVFFALGILLSLTPCVLPMIPILSAIILGQHQPQNTYRNLVLSIIYVLSMASTYALIGAVFGFFGYSLQIYLQQTWIIIIISLILITMALSLFGCYSLQLPESIRARIAAQSYKQKGGSYWGVIIMGCLSTLILSPCVTPPLVAALGYISQTGNSLLGAIDLFMLGLGSGMPLLIIGAWGPKLLPKAGAWMSIVKTILGILLLVLVIWLLSRILSPSITYLLSAALLLSIAIYLGALKTAHNFSQIISKICGIGIGIYALMLIFAILQGNPNPWHPLQRKIFNSATIAHFIIIKNLSELEQQLNSQPNRPAILDVYADWCLACKQMDRQIFHNPQLQQPLKKFLLLRADVTANTIENQTLLRQLQVVGPPTIIFYNQQHQEITKDRIIGEISAKQFLQHLQNINQ